MQRTALCSHPQAGASTARKRLWVIPGNA